MRRWNGWGDDGTNYPIPNGGLEFLQGEIGEGRLLPDAELATVMQTVPESRLPEHPLIDRDPEVRVRHARGQSFPDWLAMRALTGNSTLQ